MGNESGVTDPKSPGGKGAPDPSDEGKIPLSEFNKRIENLKSEYERKKDEAIEELREEMRDEMEERLAELREKPHPDREDRREIIDIEAELRALDANPKTKVWDERIDRRSEAKSKMSLKELDYNMAVEWIEETAEGLESTNPLSDPKKLERAITARLRDGRWGDKPLRVRVKKAWKEMAKERADASAAEEAKKKAAERESALESGIIGPERRSKDWVDLAKEGKMDNALDAIFEKQIAEQRALESRK